jgi:hypothetical protein
MKFPLEHSRTVIKHMSFAALSLQCVHAQYELLGIMGGKDCRKRKPDRPADRPKGKEEKKKKDEEQNWTSAAGKVSRMPSHMSQARGRRRETCVEVDFGRATFWCYRGERKSGVGSNLRRKQASKLRSSRFADVHSGLSN